MSCPYLPPPPSHAEVLGVAQPGAEGRVQGADVGHHGVRLQGVLGAHPANLCEDEEEEG